METTPTSARPANYHGLKTELQNIAGIIEQYPDHLKQRTFELLITAYLESGHAKSGTPSQPQAQEAQAVVNGPAEAASNLGRVGESDFSLGTDLREGEGSADLEDRINANIESSTNLLRKRIRLRTMSPMRWPTPA